MSSEKQHPAKLYLFSAMQFMLASWVTSGAAESYNEDPSATIAWVGFGLAATLCAAGLSLMNHIMRQ